MTKYFEYFLAPIIVAIEIEIVVFKIIIYQ